MKQPPDKIYLQWHGDGEPNDVGEVDGNEVTWCKDKIFEHDIEYVQASRIDALEIAIKQHREQMKRHGPHEPSPIDQQLYNALESK